MSTPVWSTTLGKIASIDEQVSYSKQLEANTSDSTAITYSIIAGSLPSGIELTSSGLLTGTPAEVAKRTRYTFAVRATAGAQITDRTFWIDVEGADTPTFTTSAGQLNLPGSTVYRTDADTVTADITSTTADMTGSFIVIDGNNVNFQIVATDSDTRAGQTLAYDIVQGSLPPGITLSTTGLISGIVEMTEDDRYGSIGGYAGSESYDDELFDRTVMSKSRSVNYDFTIRVSDGTSYVDQNNSIFVYTADFFSVDNDRLTIDQTEEGGEALTLAASMQRRPAFTTPSDLGTFRHDNEVLIKIDVSDYDPLQADLEYTIQSGSLPDGLGLSLTTGEIYGSIGRQSETEVNYSFTIRANRYIMEDLNVYTDQTFTMKVIGEEAVGITFTTPSTVGTLTTGIPSLLSIEAVSEATDDVRVLTYTVSSGSLPTGITLSQTGNLVGTLDRSNFTDSTTAYTFTVTVSDQYQSNTAATTSKEFTVNINVPHTAVDYGSMVGHSTSLIDQNIFYNIAQDLSINSPDYIYRPEDPSFGMKINPEMLMIAGLEAQTLTTLQQQMEQNHSPKTLYFGDLKTAIAKEDGVIKYEIVYIEMKDKLVNNDGDAISSSIELRTDVKKPLLGPRAGTVYLTADADEVTVTNGISMSTSGSNMTTGQLTADLGYLSTVYPNAVANMRTRMKSLGHKEWTHLPLWMRTPQSDTGAPLGFILAVPICYCKPGKSALVKKRIADKELVFRNIDFIVDRYQISQSKITPATFTADGSTSSFALDEIVHEEDILVKKGDVVVYVGDNVTADNNLSPTYLSADTQLRSADFEYEISLAHNTSTKKTTVTFVNAPDSGTIIKVARGTDKYLKFRNKGIF